MSSRLSETHRALEQVVEYRRSSNDFINRVGENEPNSITEYLDDEESSALRPHNSIMAKDLRGTMPILTRSISTKIQELQTEKAYQAHAFQTPRKFSRHQPLRCPDGCPCRCHQKSVIRSPRNLSSFLGDVFLACSSLPWCFSSLVQCNEQSCKRSQTVKADMRYFFPAWFMSNTVKITMKFTLSAIPLNVSIETRNTIPYDSPIFIAVQEGQVDEIRSLLYSGKASLNDIDPYGLGLLYVSSINRGQMVIMFKLTVSWI